MNQVKGEVLRKDPLFVSIWYKRFKIRFMCAFMKRKRKKIKSLEIHVSTNSQITIFTGFVPYLCKHSNLLELYWNWYDLLPVNKNRFINKKLKSQFINIEFKRHNLHKKKLTPKLSGSKRNPRGATMDFWSNTTSAGPILPSRGGKISKTIQVWAKMIPKSKC